MVLKEVVIYEEKLQATMSLEAVNQFAYQVIRKITEERSYTLKLSGNVQLCVII